MPSPKALILQGILGVAGLCASGAGGIGLGLGKAFKGVQSDAPAADIGDEPKINPQNTGEVVVDLGIPEECEGSCSLSAEQLKKLKFEKKGDEEIEFDGLEDSDEFELIIEVTEDQINYPKNKKYTLKPKTIGGTVTIKGIKEGNIVLGKDQEVVIREISTGGKLEHLLEEVDRLGIPKRCKADEVTGEAKTCELTKLQLQKLNFETRDSEKITVEGLSEGNLVTLKIEDKESDEDNYPKGKKYTLRSTTGPVTIKNVKEGNIVLGKDQEVLIRETSGGGKLEHLLEEVDRLGIPRRCKADEVTSEKTQKCELIQKQLKDLKFEAKEGASITVDGQSENSKFELTIEDKPNDGDNYPQGKKYTIKAKTGTATIRGVKEGDIDIWKNQSVVVRETSGGGKLERAPEEVDYLGIPESCTPGKSCSLNEYQIKNLQFVVGNEGITVEFLNKAKTVSLRVENKEDDKGNYPKGKKYTLSTWNGQVKIKGLNDGDIEIGSKEVVIREKEDAKKLERAPEEIDELGIPRRCESGSTCDLTKEQLEKLKFETNPDSSITVVGLGEGEKVELKIETPSDLTDYPKGKKYTLTAKSGTVTIQNVKGGNIEIGTKEGFVIRGKREVNKLEKVPKELNELGIPRWCKAEEVLKTSDTRSCELPQKQLKSLKFKAFEEGSEEVKVDGLSESDKIKLTISWSEDQNNYPDNKKYSFDNTKGEKDITITKDGQTVTIEKNKESRFKNNNGQLELVEAKDKAQIEKEKKIKEVREIVKKLGFEGSSTLSIEFSDINNPTKFKETKVVEFSKANKNESDLKKIQFKDLEGGATQVTGLSSSEIKVFLDWDYDESKYPNNMKFSFQNQYFSPFEFKKNNKTVSIPKKSQGTPNTTFKVEQQRDRWYLVKTNN